MPLYILECEKCHSVTERVLGIDKANPACDKCGGRTVKKPTSPAVIRIVRPGGIPERSKGYIEGYSREYLKDVQ